MSSDKFEYDESFYRGRQVLVLGGLGFIGQNLVRALVALGSEVCVVDLVGDGSDRTLGDFPAECKVYYADRCEKKLIDWELSRQDIIFNLAGRSGVADSFRYPQKSLEANCLQYLNVLQTCREHNPGAVVVFPSSCLVYGEDAYVPIPTREHGCIHPLSPYAIHKYTCEMYSRLYQETYGLSTVVLRISNPIGPHQYHVDGNYGVYNRFIYLATNECDITVYGEGSHVRDIVGIDSMIQAFLTCALHADVIDVVNIGCGVGIALRDYAQLVVDVVGSGRVVHVDWPENSKGQPFTNYVADISHICSVTDWKPDVDLSATIAATAEFYRWAGVNSLITNGAGKC